MRRLSLEKAMAVAEAIKLLYARGLVQVKGGNVSVVDRGAGLVYISPSRVPRHTIKPTLVSVIGLDGSRIRGVPSSEWRLHVEIYKRIPGSATVVHAHGPYSVMMAERLGDGEIVEPPLEEALHTVNCIAIAPRLPPGTRELAEGVSGLLAGSGCRAAIIRGHGIVVYSGGDVYEALDALESVEDSSLILLGRASPEGRR